MPLLALVFIQTVGGHVHVCLDGSEARVSVQTTVHWADFFTDSTAHQHHEPASDLDMDDNWLAPKVHSFDQATPIAFMAVTTASIMMFLAHDSYQPLAYSPPLLAYATRLHPPLRGPPVTAVV